MDSNVQNIVGCNAIPDILQDVLSHVPTYWQEDKSNFTGTACREVPVYGWERENVLAAFAQVFKDTATVDRIHNPFLWGRYDLRKYQLLARGVHLYEQRRYHPILAVDKSIVKNRNLDCRRYSNCFGLYVVKKKKPILYSDPIEAQKAFCYYSSDMKRQVFVNEVALVVVKVLETASDNLPELTKDRDTEYYPEYFIRLC